MIEVILSLIKQDVTKIAPEMCLHLHMRQTVAMLTCVSDLGGGGWGCSRVWCCEVGVIIMGPATEGGILPIIGGMPGWKNGEPGRLPAATAPGRR